MPGPVTEPLTTLFTPDELQTWPDGLEVAETLLTLSRGKSCRVSIPIANNTDRDIVLQRRTTLGRLELVRTMFEEVPPLLDTNLDGRSAADPTPEVRQINTSTNPMEPLIDLEDLSSDQQRIAEVILKKESPAFAVDDGDAGSASGLQLDVQLTDHEPVQKSYNSIPRPLYAEVKQYLKDLIARGWITKSKSSYSSLTVCVRKKDGSIRLCCDFRGLNQKTVPDRQPIPKIQDVLDSLGGNYWLSTLDQGKAYHQGYMAPESCHLTAFVTPWVFMNGPGFPLA